MTSDTSISDINLLVNTVLNMEWIGLFKIATLGCFLLIFYALFVYIRGEKSGSVYNITNNYYDKRSVKRKES